MCNMRTIITVRGKYSALFKMGLLLLCVAVGFLLQATIAWSLEQVDKTDVESISIDLQIVDGVVTGHIDKQPLGQILDIISQQTAFEYQSHDDLLKQPVSGHFEGIPLIKAMKKLLRPFNYYLIMSDGNGEIEHLYITSLKGELTVPVAVPEVLTQTEPENTAPGNLLTGLEQLTEEERLLFEVPEEEKSPPPELLDQFEPWQELGTEITGPPVPSDFMVEELPEFEVIENDTGPESIDPDVPDEVITEFEPFVSETGPSDTFETFTK